MVEAGRLEHRVVCVCVCLGLYSGRGGYSILVGPVMRLVHPIISPFALSSIWSRGRARFPPLSVLGTLAGMTLVASTSIS